MSKSLLCILVIVVSLLNNALWHNAIVNGACILVVVSVVGVLLVQRDRFAAALAVIREARHEHR